MEIGEEHLARPQPRDLRRLRFLHLDDHLGRGEDGIGVGRDARAGPLIGLIVEADAGAGAALDQHLMAVMDDFAHAAGHQPDAIFVRLHFLGNADQHATPLRQGHRERGGA